MLTAPGAIADATAARLKTYWDTNFSGDNTGKVAVLGDGLKYEAMSVNAVEVYVSRLRTKLEPAGIRIRTIRGLGYMLEDLPHDAKPA